MSPGARTWAEPGQVDAKAGARLERVRAALSKRAGGVELIAAHVVREVLERGLDSIERELGRK